MAKKKLRWSVAAFAVVLLLTAASLRAGETPTAAPDDGTADRAHCVGVLTKLAEPVLVALSENKLKATLPVGRQDKQQFAPLEATGRLLAGMAPWLELGPGADAEGKLRARYIELAVKGVGNAVDPKSPDYMLFADGQPQVDAAFLALAMLRAPKQLWGNLTAAQQANLVAALKSAGGKIHAGNNWVCFSGTIQAALWEFTGECDTRPIAQAVHLHLNWYLGDGVYGDGPAFAENYYNSYVIQPMLLAILQVCQAKNNELGQYYPLILKRAQRYAAILERMISPEGTFPVIGRSSTYRFAAFQLLSDMALRKQLPANLDPAGVRAGVTAVIRRMVEMPGTFDENGWLRPGAVGYQPSIRETYISMGSPYLCSTALLFLGLPASDPFWKGADHAWTQKRIWAGEDIEADHALTGN